MSRSFPSDTRPGVKADLERELGPLVLDCSSCGRRVHWVAGFGVAPGHWAHREPAPHPEPELWLRRHVPVPARLPGPR